MEDNQFGLITEELLHWGHLDLCDKFVAAYLNDRQDEYERLRAEGLRLVEHERSRAQWWIKQAERERRGSA